jgi:hypothetical protein
VVQLHSPEQLTERLSVAGQQVLAELVLWIVGDEGDDR